MAGDWLKMESNTPEKPEVMAITVLMGWDDPDLTVGKLFRVWRWFDQQTTDGNAPRVTTALLDRIAGALGFAEAMISEGWLTRAGSGLSLPKFDAHNGASAKARAQGAKRSANFRSNEESNADSNADSVASSVTDALPREEKRREEIEKKEPRSKTEAATPPALPDWLPLISWTGYLDMRKKQKKVPTVRAVELVIMALDKMRAEGQNVAAILDKSTANGWTDVYAIKPDARGAAPPSQKFNFAEVDRSGDRSAQAATMARHGIVVPEGEVEI